MAGLPRAICCPRDRCKASAFSRLSSCGDAAGTSSSGGGSISSHGIHGTCAPFFALAVRSASCCSPGEPHCPTIRGKTHASLPPNVGRSLREKGQFLVAWFGLGGFCQNEGILVLRRVIMGGLAKRRINSWLLGRDLHGFVGFFSANWLARMKVVSHASSRRRCVRQPVLPRAQRRSLGHAAALLHERYFSAAC